MKNIMISQPMNGLTDEIILSQRKQVTEYLESNGYHVVNSFLDTEEFHLNNMKEAGILQIPVYYLSKSIEIMSRCDAVFFCKGWQHARGCNIEHSVAKEYGLEIIYDNPPEVQIFAQKPVCITAMQWKGLQVKDHKKRILHFTKGHASIKQMLIPGDHEPTWNLCVVNPAGQQIAHIGDYVVEALDGYFYVMKEDLFHKTYNLSHDQVYCSEYEDLDS